MKRMRFVVVLLVAACSKDAPKASPLVDQARSLANEMCACRDRICSDAVATKWTALTKDQQLTAEDVEAIAYETQRFDKCLESISSPPR